MCKAIADVELSETYCPADQERAVWFLARRLYWKMEQLDPTLEGDSKWESLSDRDKRLYRLCVDDLLGFESVVLAAMKSGSHADHDKVGGRTEPTE